MPGPLRLRGPSPGSFVKNTCTDTTRHTMVLKIIWLGTFTCSWCFHISSHILSSGLSYSFHVFVLVLGHPCTHRLEVWLLAFVFGSVCVRSGPAGRSWASFLKRAASIWGSDSHMVRILVLGSGFLSGLRRPPLLNKSNVFLKSYLRQLVHNGYFSQTHHAESLLSFLFKNVNPLMKIRKSLCN